MNLSQARWQVAAVWGYLTPKSDSEKSVRACQAASWLGAVQIGLESGGDLLAVPVGHEPHPGGAEPGGTRAGGDRRLGPGLPAFASGRPVSPSHSLRALRSRAGGAPSTIRHAPTLRLCRHGRTQAALQGGSFLGPGPRSLSHVLDPVHVDADRNMGRAGGDPVNRRGPSARIAPAVDHREENSSSGRVLPHARQRQRPRR